MAEISSQRTSHPQLSRFGSAQAHHDLKEGSSRYGTRSLDALLDLSHLFGSMLLMNCRVRKGARVGGLLATTDLRGFVCRVAEPSKGERKALFFVGSGAGVGQGRCVRYSLRCSPARTNESYRDCCRIVTRNAVMARRYRLFRHSSACCGWSRSSARVREDWRRGLDAETSTRN